MKNNFKKGCSIAGRVATNDSTPFKKFFAAICYALLFFAGGCNLNNPDDNGSQIDPQNSPFCFVVNEGNFMASNGSISKYDITNKKVVNNFFEAANNGAVLGDAPTAITVAGNVGYVPISGSGKVYIINLSSGALKDKITGLNSPRSVALIDDKKGYISNLFENKIDVFDRKTNSLTGAIELPKGCFAEEFVMAGEFVYTNCWSYGTKILRIDPRTDKVVAELEVGVQPYKMRKEAKSGKLWVLTDGGWEGNETGYEKPTLVCIDPATFTIEKRIAFERSAAAYWLTMELYGNEIYLANGDLYKVPTSANALPSQPFIRAQGRSFHAVGLFSTNVYISDAVDYQQAGKIYIYNNKGELTDSFATGVIPGAFSMALL